MKIMDLECLANQNDEDSESTGRGAENLDEIRIGLWWMALTSRRRQTPSSAYWRLNRARKLEQA
jgi:hypothetical protein